MEQKFELNLERPADTLVRDDELRPLLERLHGDCSHPEDEIALQLTVAEVVEGTGKSVEEVFEALALLREERMAAVLRELEEPLYRVERPVTSGSDPLISASVFSRFLQRRSSLDELRRVDLVVVKKPKKSKEEVDSENRSQFHSTLFLYLLLAVMLAAIVVPLMLART